MLDPKLLRNELDTVADKLRIRGFSLDTAKMASLEKERKAYQAELEALQNERNVLSKQIGQAKAKGEDPKKVLEKVGEIGKKLDNIKQQFDTVQAALTDITHGIPNIPQADVPEGQDENDNVEVKTWGEPKQFDFKPKDHVDIGEAMKQMDFEVAAKLASSRFVVLYKDLARLHRALIQFMMDVHVKEHGYTEVYVPYIVNEASMFGTGQLPKFRDDQFNIDDARRLSLISTAEIPVTNLVRDEIVDEGYLPLKYVSHTPCFRSEAGSYGKDTRGMIRNHQFEKVELVQIVKPEDSLKAHEELTAHAEKILQLFDLPYRVVNLCGGDLGFSSSKTYDLEVWFPSQNQYREISSCSNFQDFQARRMQARYRDAETNKPRLVHTLNGSGLAVGRTLIAIMENYQREAGGFDIPDVLSPYLR